METLQNQFIFTEKSRK